MGMLFSATQAITQLLQPVGEGVFDRNWKIRHPDVQQLVVLEICPVGGEGKTRHRQGS